MGWKVNRDPKNAFFKIAMVGPITLREAVMSVLET
jgi:hypothetical protein